MLIFFSGQKRVLHTFCKPLLIVEVLIVCRDFHFSRWKCSFTFFPSYSHHFSEEFIFASFLYHCLFSLKFIFIFTKLLEINVTSCISKINLTKTCSLTIKTRWRCQGEYCEAEEAPWRLSSVLPSYNIAPLRKWTCLVLCQCTSIA